MKEEDKYIEEDEGKVVSWEVKLIPFPLKRNGFSSCLFPLSLLSFLSLPATSTSTSILKLGVIFFSIVRGQIVLSMRRAQRGVEIEERREGEEERREEEEGEKGEEGEEGDVWVSLVTSEIHVTVNNAMIEIDRQIDIQIDIEGQAEIDG